MGERRGYPKSASCGISSPSSEAGDAEHRHSHSVRWMDYDLVKKGNF